MPIETATCATLGPAFFERPADLVARELLGSAVVRRIRGERIALTISETEAYLGPHDLACHAARGRTARTEVMFGPPGHAYVYLIYGMHHCVNAVTEREGHAAAVLIRALEPGPGVQGRTDGPGRLCKALEIDRSHNGLDLTRSGALYITAGRRAAGVARPDEEVKSGP